MTKKYIYVGAAVALIGGAIASLGWLVSVGTQSPAAQANEVVELKDGDTYDLTASYVTKEIGGKPLKMLAYNSSIPGPTIRVPQGAEVTINFTNDTDMKALLHSHGVRMDNAFDGAQTSQEEMEPGESFAYTLKFPDAGVYWYHPHVNEVYGQALGLYGAFVVVPEDAAYFPPVNREEVLFFSDLPVENGVIGIDKSGTDFSLMGHFGNVMLVNGQEDYALSAKRGEVVRLYLVNASNVRPLNISIPGARLKVVGGDNGAYEKAFFTDSVVLAPSERAIVDVLITGSAEIVNQIPDHTIGLASITVDDGPIEISYGAEFNQLQNNADTKDSIDPFRAYFDKAPDKTITLSVDMMGMPSMGGHMMSDGTQMQGMMMGEVPEDGIEWEDHGMEMMNQMSNTDSVTWNIVDQGTGRKNMDIDWTFTQGRPVKIRIFNDPKSMHPMQHPIHFHGQRFLVVARDGVPQSNFVWKDTTLVKAGETVDIILDPSNPGTWMAHCHISEHLAAGMMLMFRVQ